MKLNHNIKITSSIIVFILTAVLFCQIHQAYGGVAKCYDGNVLTYFYSLTTQVDEALIAFNVPRSFYSDNTEVRLFGEPRWWQRKNLWNHAVRRERYIEVLLNIACLADYKPERIKAFLLEYLNAAPSEIKSSPLYNLLSDYYIQKGLDLNSNLVDIQQIFKPVETGQSIIQFIESVNFIDPEAHAWITPFKEVASEIGLIGNIIGMEATAYDIIVTTLLGQLMANEAAIIRFNSIKLALEGDSILWNDPAFREAIDTVQEFLEKSDTQQAIKIIRDELNEHWLDIINGVNTLATISAGKNVLQGLTNLVTNKFSYLSSGGWIIGLHALKKEFLIIIGINKQLENAELAVCSATVARELCSGTPDKCKLRVPAIYGYLKSTEYVIDAFDWEPFWFWSFGDVVGIWEEAKTLSSIRLDEEYNYICNGVLPPTPKLTVSEMSGIPNNDELSFNNTLVGEHVTEIFTLINNGTGDLIIDSWVSNNSVFSLSPVNPSGSSGNVTLPPGDNINVQVIFSPEVNTNYNGIIEVNSNDPEQNQYHISIKGAGGAGISPYIKITSPNQANETAHEIYIVRWYDSDPDSNADILLYYDTDTDPNNGKNSITSEPQKEDWAGNFYPWDTSKISEGVYYVCAVITDGVNDPVTRYSAGTVKIDHPNVADNFTISSAVARDNNTDGDGDGVMESGEEADYKITIKNHSGNTFYTVHADLTTSTTEVTVTDSRVVYGNMSGGSSSSGDEDFNFDTDPGFVGTAEFTLNIKYEDDGGTEYYDSELLTVTIFRDGTTTCSLSVGSIIIDDSGSKGDNDGIFESGERADFYVELKNSGNAPCINPEGIINQLTTWGSDVLTDRENNYPDIPIGGSVTNIGDYDTDQAPYTFSGPLNMTMVVNYGVQRDFSQQVNFTLDVVAAPYMNVLPETYDFGIVINPTFVNKEINIINNGSGDLSIFSIDTSHPSDSSISGIDSFPLTISPGSSSNFTINIDTSNIHNEFITRTVTVNSNANKEPIQTVTVTGSVLDHIPQSTYKKIWNIITPQRPEGNEPDFTNLAIGDTDNDGIPEILATEAGTIYGDTQTPYPGRLYIYEKVGDDNFQLKWESGDLGGVFAQGLALGDFDTDGYKDIVVLARSNYISTSQLPCRVYWFEATGNDSWVQRGVPIVESSNVLLSMDVGDSDDDGKLEIIVTHKDANDDPKVKMYEYSGGSFINRWTSPIILEPGGDPVFGVVGLTIADSDGDGNSEIIFGTSEAQLLIYEKTGDNSYTERLYYQNYDYLGSDWDPEDVSIKVSDTDEDGKNEIIYTSSEGYLFILETTGNNTWNESAPEHYLLPGGTDGHSLAIGDTDDDGKKEIVVGMRKTSSNPGLAVFEAEGDNFHTSSWQSSDTEAPDDVFSLAILNTNSSPYNEIISSYYDEGFGVLTYAPSVDVQIVENNISFDPELPLENENITITAIVQNLGDSNINNVTVRFYDSDPDTGGTQIGNEQVITTITGGSEETAQVMWQPISASTYSIYVVIDPDNTIPETDETNNKASKDIVVVDDDVTGPTISDIIVEEYNGDGDGLIEADEQIKISIEVADPSGVDSISYTINGDNYSDTGNCQTTVGSSQIAGPFPVGNHNFTISTIDCDNTPESSEFSGIFKVFLHAPAVFSTTPINGAINISLNPEITVTFNEDLDTATVNETTITVENSSQHAISGSVSYDPVLNRILFSPSKDLNNSETYTITLMSGANGIKDENGNEMEADYNWSFTTEADTELPIAIIGSPDDSAVVKETITIFGSAWDRNFNNYQLFYGIGTTPVEWNQITELVTSSVINDSLATWNTTVVSDDTYTLKLVVTDTPPASNSTEDTVVITVSNSACTPTNPPDEICDDLDNNCNGTTDEGCDDDNDNYCDTNITLVGTPAICPNGGGDCDDLAPAINPGTAEICDDLDNNCIDGVDEGCDDDNDDYCDASMTTVETPDVCPNGGGDCNDVVPTINPGVAELCNDFTDNDCDSEIDEPDCEEQICSLQQNPPRIEVPIGESQVVVPIIIDNAPNDVAAFTFNVNFDAQILEYTSSFQRGDCTQDFDLLDVTPQSPGVLLVSGVEAGSDIIPQGNSCTIVELVFNTLTEKEICTPVTLSDKTGEIRDWGSCDGEICRYVIGDVNNNGCVDIMDVLCLYRYVIGNPSCLDEANSCYSCADVDGNGVVDIMDVLCLYRFVIGNPSCIDGLNIPLCN